ncbi:hypothetical protein ATANTOWER_014418 [Ataeniobius toweri]|uniref:Uncharacterized protein n=1 Tax=Ataeniobius toweri TaxID=208326 RepID=A0ABU7B335_9TELE|nr:hypothetical protein [Ataeniobius toweri]
MLTHLSPFPDTLHLLFRVELTSVQFVNSHVVSRHFTKSIQSNHTDFKSGTYIPINSDYQTVQSDSVYYSNCLKSFSVQESAADFIESVTCSIDSSWMSM